MACGTESGVKAHKQRNEPPCPGCKKYMTNPNPAIIAIRQPVKCGTRQGRAKHQRNGEPVCDPCRLAYNKYTRAQYANRERTAQVKGEIIHGTVWGYQQHKSRGDEDCEPCRTAANEKRREYNAKKAAKQ